MAQNIYTNVSKNITKTWMLMALFFCLIIALGYFLSLYYGSANILYFFVIFSILMNLTSYWFSDKIVLALSGAKEIKKSEYFDLYTVLENLSIVAGLPMPRIYVIEDLAPNAFATGRDKNHAVVAVTTGLISLLDRSELEGVLGHELSHIGNRDMLLSTVVVVLVGFVSIISDIFTRSLIFHGGDRDHKGGNVLMLIGIIFAILSPFFALLIQLAISRKREFLADASGALLTRYPEGLARALKKISQYSRPMIRQSSAIAHLYIADPKGGGFGKRITGLFATHPPVEQRIKALMG
ncbi:zinc metalloprotease HtpX [Candidatus Nomurabacteria bacterium RIFCSPHIGHO2_02_FULL_41_18]|uniref:Protease HtpX homolog n=1 Tax=Candidatus Nomurabacteria bacterium RIFCSPHIGHO2_02_FULL_41_18 TaxID=1801754 RepID=A0A1F6W8N7_9BACT|nr:MAG: zinc metalloprotease HtpX [Candidatus Nomurabacteria bacterium RIFCSPHIGHO2_01_FULL_41_71]OGI78136.1 MAG: zinc metalloprotease HtpX [Candidatus Nomurabacteria bacterium RIFCSPHIGHO2_02_FULL_41_18]OGI90318.1 MAG: zinc metalloprotease HtpX [Candidatus Nomurabacteria bacterium RIFCSPLOWO2_01_FULL_41_52b]OGJ00553.1 MAG: zinc metalloprotease HtpX [Candidatus Nomurabacteria bacterium RIFCSPLOWO2_02_FULL_41_9]